VHGGTLELLEKVLKPVADCNVERPRDQAQPFFCRGSSVVGITSGEVFLGVPELQLAALNSELFP